jgi:NitT/TauT family transport system permease protein
VLANPDDMFDTFDALRVQQWLSRWRPAGRTELALLGPCVQTIKLDHGPLRWHDPSAFTLTRHGSRRDRSERFRPVRLLLEPWTEFFRFIPAVAMITVAVIWFGIGEESKVFLIAYTTVFVVIIATAAGVGAVGRDKIRAAQSMGANKLQIFALVALPATVPYILTGMRLAMANAFVTIVAAELVASNDGLGKLLWDARLFMQIEDIFVALISLGMLGFLTDRVFRLLIRAFAGRFNPTM